MIVKLLTDLDLINKTILNPKINKGVSDDYTNNQRIESLGGFLWLGVYDKAEYLGLIMAHKHSEIMYEVHTALLPKAWGKKAIQCTKACYQWLIDNTLCLRVITAVPENNPLALRLAKMTGFKEYGFNPKSIQKDKMLIGQAMLGLNKEEYLCH